MKRMILSVCMSAPRRRDCRGRAQIPIDQLQILNSPEIRSWPG